LAAGVKTSDVIIKSVQEVTTNRRISIAGFTSYSIRFLLATSVEVVSEIQTNNAATEMNQLTQESLTAQLSDEPGVQVQSLMSSLAPRESELEGHSTQEELPWVNLNVPEGQVVHVPPLAPE